MSYKGINLMEPAKTAWLTSGFFDDFYGLDTQFWNTTVTDSGTVAEDADDANGVIVFTPSDGSVADNDEAYLYTNEVSKFLRDKPILIGARIQYAEAATSAANIIFGMGEGFGVANTLLDNGGGPPADYDGFCFYKVDGGTRWFFETSLGTTQQTFELDYTAGGAGFVSLVLECYPINATEIEVVPWIDTTGTNAFIQALPYSANFNPRRIPVKSRFAYSSPGEMCICLGIKNGSTTLETMKADLALQYQAR